MIQWVWRMDGYCQCLFIVGMNPSPAPFDTCRPSPWVSSRRCSAPSMTRRATRTRALRALRCAAGPVSGCPLAHGFFSAACKLRSCWQMSGCTGCATERLAGSPLPCTKAGWAGLHLNCCNCHSQLCIGPFLPADLHKIRIVASLASCGAAVCGVLLWNKKSA